MTKFKSKSKEGKKSKNRAETEKEDDELDGEESPTDSISEQPPTKSKGRCCTNNAGARTLVTIWFAFSLIFNLLSVTLLFFIQIKYGGQPPTSYYQWGAVVSIAVSFLSMAASILAIIIVDFCQLTVCPFECFSGTAIIIMVMATWGVCSIGCCATAYAYGDAWMDPEAISNFTKNYYAKNGVAPPFLDTLQKRFGGLCCGGVGFSDYGQFNGNVSYIHLPASCCLTKKRDSKTGPDLYDGNIVESANTPLRKTGQTCGTYQWVPFYLSLEEFLKWSLRLMDDGSEGKEVDFFKVLLKRAGPYMIDRYEKYQPQMVRELANRYKQERPQAYKKINRDAKSLFPGDPTKQQDYIKETTEQESLDFIETKRVNFEDKTAVSKYMVSVPYGCGEMVSFLLFSEWIGTREGKFSNFRSEHEFIFWGLLVMALSGVCINLTNISLFTYGVAIPRPFRDGQDNEGKRKGSNDSGGSTESDNIDEEKGIAIDNEDGSGDKKGDNGAKNGTEKNPPTPTEENPKDPGDTSTAEQPDQPEQPNNSFLRRFF